MKKQDYTWKWLDDGTCEVTSQVLDAVKVGSNGNKVFYNQIIGWMTSKREYGKNATFGDGSPLPQDAIWDLKKFMDDNASVYRWHPGMFVVIDNSVAYHSR